MPTTTEVIKAFLYGESKSTKNVQTDGRSLYLFGNLIARHSEDGLYITHAGWETRSTFRYLNELPNVRINRRNKQTYLNGELWDGQMTKVTSASPPPVQPSKVFIKATTWVKSDGWRGYYRPIYAIAGANDTGMWSDSPCPSDVATNELNELRKALRDKAGIPAREMICETSNVFCARRYLIVRPTDMDKAREVVTQHLDEVPSRLLYAC